MPWVITNNSFFIKSDKRGCATPVKDGKKAKVFTDLFYAEEFLRSLCGKEHHLGMSRGYIKDGETHVINGPLVGMERRIRKIDRHKRIARVMLPAGEPGRLMAAGLEITSRS